MWPRELLKPYFSFCWRMVGAVNCASAVGSKKKRTKPLSAEGFWIRRRVELLGDLGGELVRLPALEPESGDGEDEVTVLEILSP